MKTKKLLALLLGLLMLVSVMPMGALAEEEDDPAEPALVAPIAAEEEDEPAEEPAEPVVLEPVADPIETNLLEEAAETMDIDSNSYYLIGSMTSWNVDESLKFTLSSGNEYVLEVNNLPENAEFKVVKGNKDTWYPDQGGNYTVSAANSGHVRIWFRPSGDREGWEGWHYGYIYVEPVVNLTINEPSHGSLSMIMNGSEPSYAAPYNSLAGKGNYHIIASADEGYELVSVTCNNQTIVPNGNGEHWVDLQADSEISATFKLIERHSLVLKESIGLDFYFGIPENYTYPTANYYIFGRNGQITKTGHADPVSVTDNGVNLVKYTVNINALQIKNSVTISIEPNPTGNPYATFDASSSVYDVCKAYMSQNGSTTNLYKLAAQIISYGYYARDYLISLNSLDADNYGQIDHPEGDALYEVSAGDLAANAIVRPSDVKFALDAKETIDIILYFPTTATLTCDNGKTVTASGTKEIGGVTYYCYTISGIKPTEYTTTYTITGYAGGNVQVSVLSYIHAALVKGDTKLVAFVKTLYGYHKKALAYDPANPNA